MPLKMMAGECVGGDDISRVLFVCLYNIMTRLVSAGPGCVFLLGGGLSCSGRGFCRRRAERGTGRVESGACPWSRHLSPAFVVACLSVQARIWRYCYTGRAFFFCRFRALASFGYSSIGAQLFPLSPLLSGPGIAPVAASYSASVNLFSLDAAGCVCVCICVLSCVVRANSPCGEGCLNKKILDEFGIFEEGEETWEVDSCSTGGGIEDW